MPKRTVPNPFAWALCICLAAALISIIAFLLQQPPPHYRAEPTKADYQNNEPSPSGGAAGHPNSDHQGSNKRKWYSIVTEHPTDWLLVVFNLLLAFYTARLFYATSGLVAAAREQSQDTKTALSISDKSAEAAQRSADVAKNTLIAAQRPWIQIKNIKIAGPLEFVDEQARINLEFTLKNVGKSPALRTDLQIKLTISNTIDPRAEQKNYADLMIAAREYAETNPHVVQTEFGFFPDEEITFFRTAWMDPTELARFREWAGKIPGATIYPAVVGGVFYEFTFEKGHHQTGIIFGLQKRTPYPAPQRPSYAVFPDHMPIQDVRGAIHLEGAIPMDDLIFAALIVGTGPIT